MTRARFAIYGACLVLALAAAIIVPLAIIGQKASDADERSTTNLEFLRGEEGIPGVPGRNGVDGAPGPPGARGPGPSVAQVQAAVRLYCRQRTCRGVRGPSGRRGREGRRGGGPSRAQVAAAVRAYCADNGCRGAQGAVGPRGFLGPRGFPGVDGRDGPPGPPPAAFTFTAQGVTYVCSSPRMDLTYDCVEQPPAP